MTTVTEIEKRILDACKTIRALPDPEARFFQYRSLWPDAPQSIEEGYGWHEAAMPRFRPSPAQVSDCLPALALMRGLPRREWRLIWWRSLGWGFRHIAAKIGRSDETARQRYRDVLLKVWWTNENNTWNSRGKSDKARGVGAGHAWRIAHIANIQPIALRRAAAGRPPPTG